MSERSGQHLRTVAFGGLDGGPRGVAITVGGSPLLLTGTVERPLEAVGQAQLSAAGDGDWVLRAATVELTVSGSGEPSRPPGEEGPAGLDQLCTVRGHATIDGTEVPVDTPGMRAIRTDLDLRALDSLRWVSAWFEDQEGLAVVALRPRKSRGHDRESITASVLEPTGPRAVSDPRLSTTYDVHGIPRRAGLELWLEGEDGHQYSRRAAGQSLAAATTVSEPPLEVLAEPMGWHSRGREGAGVYVLARPG